MASIHDDLVPQPDRAGALNRAANPFAFEVGRVPPVFGSRHEQLTAGADHLQRLLDRRPGGLRILEGPRGMGKTALMARFRATARDHNIVTVPIELTGDQKTSEASVRRALLEAAQQIAGGGQLRKVSRRLVALRVGPAGVKLADPTDEPAHLRDLVAELGVLAADVDRPVFLTIDEAREAPVLAGHVVSGMHVAMQDEHPIGAYLAGLPGTQRDIAEVYSYTERVRVDLLDSLDATGVDEAITGPFAAHGLQVEPEVWQAVHRETAGYPYFVQVWGAALWDNAASAERVDLADVTRARPTVQRTIAAFLERRWARFTPAQRRYLHAAAESGPAPRTAAIAERLGQQPSSLTYVRDGLVSEGVLYAPERGRIDFVIPPLADHARTAGEDRDAQHR